MIRALALVCLALVGIHDPSYAQTRTFSATLDCGTTRSVSIAGPAFGATTATISIDGDVTRLRAIENLSVLAGSASYSQQDAAVEVGLDSLGSTVVAASVGHGVTTFGALSAWDGVLDFSGSSGASALFSNFYNASSSGPSAPWIGRRVVLWIRTSDSPLTITGTTGSLASQYGCTATVSGVVQFN